MAVCGVATVVMRLPRQPQWRGLRPSSGRSSRAPASATEVRVGLNISTPSGYHRHNNAVNGNSECRRDPSVRGELFVVGIRGIHNRLLVAPASAQYWHVSSSGKMRHFSIKAARRANNQQKNCHITVASEMAVMGSLVIARLSAVVAVSVTAHHAFVRRQPPRQVNQ